MRKSPHTEDHRKGRTTDSFRLIFAKLHPASVSISIFISLLCPAPFASADAFTASIAELPNMKLLLDRGDIREIDYQRFERTYARDGSPDEKDSACERLSTDTSIPEAVRRWAELWRIELAFSADNHPHALTLGESWIQRNPTDPVATALRFRLASMCASAAYSAEDVSFNERLQIVIRILDPLLNHPDKCNPDSIRAYPRYALCVSLIGGQATAAIRRDNYSTAAKSESAAVALQYRIHEYKILQAGILRCEECLEIPVPESLDHIEDEEELLRLQQLKEAQRTAKLEMTGIGEHAAAVKSALDRAQRAVDGPRLRAIEDAVDSIIKDPVE